MNAAIQYLQTLNVLQPDQMAKVVHLFYAPPEKVLSPEQKMDIIIEKVCEFKKVLPEQIQKRIRYREIVEARQMISYFCCKYKVATLKAIGPYIAKQDHTTVLYARETVSALMFAYPHYKQEIETLDEIILQSLKLIPND